MIKGGKSFIRSKTCEAIYKKKKGDVILVPSYAALIAPSHCCARFGTLISCRFRKSWMGRGEQEEGAKGIPT